MFCRLVGPTVLGEFRVPSRPSILFVLVSNCFNIIFSGVFALYKETIDKVRGAYKLVETVYCVSSMPSISFGLVVWE